MTPQVIVFIAVFVVFGVGLNVWAGVANIKSAMAPNNPLAPFNGVLGCFNICAAAGLIVVAVWLARAA